MSEGRFIVVEGIDGSGSTSLVARLAAHFNSAGRPVHRTFEPSSGPIGTMIRHILAHRIVVPSDAGARAPGFATMALLFAADRRDHLEAEVLPRLQKGTTVISDRYDLSSLAYQSATAQSRDAAEAARVLAWIRELNRFARRPDLTLVLDVHPDVAAERRGARGGSKELYEELELQARLASAYADAEGLVPGDRIVHVDANRGLDAVVHSAISAIEMP
ncbi:MAG TPA: dTMP kinase [Polyangiaceae bacterium]|nr:dTMP kinase [Polyangiaceae bacterium]